MLPPASLFILDSVSNISSWCRCGADSTAASDRHFVPTRLKKPVGHKTNKASSAIVQLIMIKDTLKQGDWR